MAACTFRNLTQCQCILSSVSCLHETGQIHKQQENNTRPGIQFGTQSKVTRRLVLESIGFTAALLNVAHPVAAAPMPDSMEPEVLRTRRQADGVIIQDVVDGIGIAAQEGDLVEVNYVCRRSNGYFVHSTVDQFNGESKPVILPLDDKQIIRGLKQVLIGMKVGGNSRVYKSLFITHGLYYGIMPQQKLACGKFLLKLIVCCREEKGINTSISRIC
ncbi:hypothetical protein MKW94_012764 [Papaver nudicaule]|uniref:peptidylprolyl isomerase n=1 Tax=Papaver nudicaule TaxID=74823 RepID=A0AA41V548_PAPNU|nr:hypothetical protein [Papaver nudicaule]